MMQYINIEYLLLHACQKLRNDAIYQYQYIVACQNIHAIYQYNMSLLRS